MKKPPIGIQSIQKILSTGEYVYVDKTGYVELLIEKGSHYFLARPRRFGKSVFLDTLREIFKGDKELFKECHIYQGNYDWPKHPVIYLDFSSIASRNPDEFEEGLKRRLKNIGAEKNISIDAPTIQDAVEALVTALSSQENRVVVLVDEYDHPIINNLKNIEVAKGNRDLLKGLFTTLKSLDQHLEFVFVTGVSKFSQVSLFSGPNNLRDITMDPRYACLMGYTEEELRRSFAPHIQAIAQERGEGTEEVIKEVREWYNGYRFSASEASVYNPFSTLNFMEDKIPRAYWYSSGTPSFLIDQLRKQPFSVSTLSGTVTSMGDLLDISSLEYIDIPALMFQTGYLTIQDYNPKDQSYHLDFPNREVREAFYHSLIKEFTRINPFDVAKTAEVVRHDLERYELGSFVDQMNAHFAKIAYQLFSPSNEQFFHAVFFTFLEKSGIHTTAEVATNIGRIDLVSETPRAVYILELKLDKTAEAALNQASVKKYNERYLHSGKEVLVMGINFSSTSRNISDWKAIVFDAHGNVKLEQKRG